jgi:mannose-1-phosphate guanylyltransferase
VGAQPRGPEVEYGWIKVGDPVYSHREAFLVRGFHEKPPKDIAQILWEQGSLWNTFVMVGKVLGFLELVCSAQPGLLNLFRRSPSLWAPGEQVNLEDSLYESLIPRDFSREVLARETNRLVVQRLGPVEWSDLGDCDRAASTLECGPKPEWAANWRAVKRSVEYVASAVA